MRKDEKMKVAERRKIHIMAFPQWTPLKTSWSAAQSSAKSRRASGGPPAASSPGRITVDMPSLSSGRYEQSQHQNPDEQQEMPVSGGELDRQRRRSASARTPHRQAPEPQAPDEVEAVKGGDHVEEGVGRVRLEEIRSEERRGGKECV